MLSFRLLRRLLLGLIALGACLAVWAFLIEPDLLRVTEMTVETAKWPAERESLRIAALGDLHTGAPHIDREKLEDAVAAINRLEPEIVVLLGDYVIQGVLFGEFIDPAVTAEILAGLRPKYGSYAVLGNHDWWYDGVAIGRLLEEAGIAVLENEAARVDSPAGAFWIAGIADDMTRSPDPRGTFTQIPAGEAVIAITHDPAVFPDVPIRTALTLAGHTHGGQVYLPLYGAPIVPGSAPRRYAYGHIRENGKDLYVTAGLGTSILPLRFNMPPEIALITLKGLESR